MSIEFDTAFQAITGFVPLRWQRRLYHRMFHGDIPQVCCLPTGLGKTAIVPIWLLALTGQAAQARVTLPRRLVYIIHRRTTVDQVTSLSERIRERLLNPPSDAAERVAAILRTLVSTGDPAVPLAVSTLRGALADNREWTADPSRAAIIVGTVDMAGSRLLFSGYGDGPRLRPVHAGLLGHDSLVVLDGGYLTPAFTCTLRAIEEAQRRTAGTGSRPMHVVELTAIPRPEHRRSQRVFRLEPEDLEDQFVRTRLQAPKTLTIHKTDAQRLTAKVASIAGDLKKEGGRVLVFLNTPEHAENVAQLLKNRHRIPPQRIEVLTGTLRGWERENHLRESPVLKAFLEPGARPDSTVYLVCTSAGEASTDFHGDHVVTDATALDSLIHRAGRCNREGRRDGTPQIHLVATADAGGKKPTPVSEAARRTTEILRDLTREGGDFSPGRVTQLVESLDDRTLQECCFPAPDTPAFQDTTAELLSLTGLPGDIPGQHETHDLLHGLEHEPPETSVCWRAEVTALARQDTTQEELARWFEHCRILPHETLRDRTGRVRKKLLALLRNHRDFPIVILNPGGRPVPVHRDGMTRWPKLSDIDTVKLEHHTVVLPPEAGGLDEHGALDPACPAPARDVAEDPPGPNTGGPATRTRWVVTRDPDGEETWTPLQARPGDGTDRQRPKGREVCRVQLPGNGDDPEHARFLVLLESQPSPKSRGRQSLSDHTRAVVENCRRISGALQLPEPLALALENAAAWHDAGKAHRIWQRYARADTAREDELPLARSDSYLQPENLLGYRHELGSLIRAARELHGLPDDVRDLCLHIVASHHGRARPHFDEKAHRMAGCRDADCACAEAARRFVRLQRALGPWQLAWLEALFRCADAAAAGRQEEDA